MTLLLRLAGFYRRCTVNLICSADISLTQLFICRASLQLLNAEIISHFLTRWIFCLCHLAVVLVLPGAPPPASLPADAGRAALPL